MITYETSRIVLVALALFVVGGTVACGTPDDSSLTGSRLSTRDRGDDDDDDDDDDDNGKKPSKTTKTPEPVIERSPTQTPAATTATNTTEDERPEPTPAAPADTPDAKEKSSLQVASEALHACLIGCATEECADTCWMDFATALGGGGP